MSGSSGVKVEETCIKSFNELKLDKKYRYIIYKLSDDNRNIEIDELGEDQKGEDEQGDEDKWEVFRQKLEAAGKTGPDGEGSKMPRYAVYDFQYTLSAQEGRRNKILFIAWSPDEAPVKPKMVYASSRNALRQALNGVAADLQANDSEMLEFNEVRETISKGRH